MGRIHMINHDNGNGGRGRQWGHSLLVYFLLFKARLKTSYKIFTIVFLGDGYMGLL